MLFEHWIYSFAIAILVYTFYRKKECIYIIVGSAYAPDIDFLTGKISKYFDMVANLQYAQHGNFHNMPVVIIYAVLLMLFLKNINIRMKDSFILANIGFGLHLLEDAIVYNPGYRFFWPISDKIYGIGLLDYNGHRDLYGFANTDVLIIGIVLVILSIIIKYILDNNIKNIVVTNGRGGL